MLFWRVWWPEWKMELGILLNKVVSSFLWRLLILMLRCGIRRFLEVLIVKLSWQKLVVVGNSSEAFSISGFLGAMSCYGAQMRGGFLWPALVVRRGGGLVCFSLRREDGGDSMLRLLSGEPFTRGLVLALMCCPCVSWPNGSPLPGVQSPSGGFLQSIAGARY
jgi:hypothetical protein